MGWLADGMEDEGGIFFELEQEQLLIDELDERKEQKKKEKEAREGKYVVSTTGKSSGHQVYFQNVKKGGYWTRFLTNAILFDTLEQAQKERKNFIYGNPKIGVIHNGNCKWVK